MSERDPQTADSDHPTLGADYRQGPDGPSLGHGSAPLASEYQDVFQMVQQYNPNGSGFFLLSLRKKFFDGDLITVGFQQNDGRDVMNFVLKRGNDLEIFRNESQVLDGVARRSAARRGIPGVLQSDNMPGLIAILIIFCIVGLVILHPADPKIPDVLSSGLALVLGFYFGRKSS